MITLRHALVVAVAATIMLPAGGLASASISGTEAVRQLASEAAELIAEEAELVRMTDPAVTESSVDRAAITARLRTVDGQGETALAQLRGLGATITPAVESALEQLPAEVLTGADAEGVSLAPGAVVYDAAVDDLLRMAATPAAVVPTDRSNGPSYALLIVAAFALLVLGIATLTNTLWRRPTEESAHTWSDELTGLANRRRLDLDLASRDATAGETAVIMVDVDHLATIEDQHGVEVRDDVVRSLSTVFEQHIRTDDVIYRYADERFCVLLPGASEDEARIVGDRIVEAAHRVALPDGRHTTVSVGVAQSADRAVADSLAHADHALSLAKRAGCNQAVFAADHELVEA